MRERYRLSPSGVIITDTNVNHIVCVVSDGQETLAKQIVAFLNNEWNAYVKKMGWEDSVQETVPERSTPEDETSMIGGKPLFKSFSNEREKSVYDADGVDEVIAELKRQLNDSIVAYQTYADRLRLVIDRPDMPADRIPDTIDNLLLQLRQQITMLELQVAGPFPPDPQATIMPEAMLRMVEVMKKSQEPALINCGMHWLNPKQIVAIRYHATTRSVKREIPNKKVPSCTIHMSTGIAMHVQVKDVIEMLARHGIEPTE